MQIEFKADDIDKYVKDVFIKSSIGDALKKEIDKTVASCLSSWNSPVQKIVSEHIANIIGEYMREEVNAKLISDAVAKVLTSDTITKIVHFGVQKLQEETRSYRENN